MKMGWFRHVGILLLQTLLVSAAWSIPAPEQIYEDKQPDGTSIFITKRGDERFHYLESSDGYPMVRDQKGSLRYVDENGKPSAKKPVKKEEALRKLRQQVVNPIDPHAEAKLDSAYMELPSATAPQRMPAINPNLKSGEKNALVILVQFKDIKFSAEEPQALFDSLLNQESYNNNNNAGSARDYFIDNSKGIFRPHFDVVGPITLSKTNYANYGEGSPYGTAGAQIALMEALDTLISHKFDFSKYDNNGDRYLDFVHMIFAGFGAHDSNQDSAIWPHKWIFGSAYRVSNFPRKLYVEPYACSAELDGYSNKMDSSARRTSGVGQFLHEFSHLLGLQDLYSNNSSIYTPSTWDIMDAGAYDRLSIRDVAGTIPPNYSAFERLSLGWITPTELNVKGTVQLSSIQNNVALRVTDSRNSDEFFLMEYRSLTGWDKALPYHGMLIWHIDYQKTVWDSARVNTTPHQYIDIEEAAGDGSSTNRAKIPFPGTARVTKFNKFVTWDSTDLNVSLSGITESRSYSYVTFKVDMDADSGSISLMEGVSEELLDISSASEADEPEQESSSSEAISSQAEISSSSAIPPKIELTDAIARELQINSTNSDIVLLQAFSINGQLLFQEKISGSIPVAKLREFRQPLLLSISRNGKKVKRSLFIFRE